MASGFMIGFQHALLDLPELTKEEFIKLCDDQFYHLSYFGMSLEEAKCRMRTNQDKRINDLANKESEFQAFLNMPAEAQKNEYERYVLETKAANERHRETFQNEMSRMITIRQWTQHIPQLSNIFEKFVEPKLYVEDVAPYEKWFEARVLGFSRQIEYRKEDIERYAHTVPEEEEIVTAYEQAKAKLLEAN